MKTCTKCHETLPASEFRWRESKGRHNASCLACEREYERIKSGRSGACKRAPWPPEEEQLIRDMYPSVGRTGILELLPHRTASAVRNKVAELGVRYSGGVMPRSAVACRAPDWSADEDRIMFEVYPLGGSAAVMPLLPGRSQTAITKRAHRLGVVVSRPEPRAVKASEVPVSWPVPQHDYTPADFAIREWRTVRPVGSVFAPSLGLAA